MVLVDAGIRSWTPDASYGTISIRRRRSRSSSAGPRDQNRARAERGATTQIRASVSGPRSDAGHRPAHRVPRPVYPAATDPEAHATLRRVRQRHVLAKMRFVIVGLQSRLSPVFARLRLSETSSRPRPSAIGITRTRWSPQRETFRASRPALMASGSNMTSSAMSGRALQTWKALRPTWPPPMTTRALLG